MVNYSVYARDYALRAVGRVIRRQYRSWFLMCVPGHARHAGAGGISPATDRGTTAVFTNIFAGVLRKFTVTRCTDDRLHLAKAPIRAAPGMD